MQQIIMYRCNVNALEHYSVTNNLTRYKLLLELGVLYEILKLVFAELGHSRNVTDMLQELRTTCRVLGNVAGEVLEPMLNMSILVPASPTIVVGGHSWSRIWVLAIF